MWTAPSIGNDDDDNDDDNNNNNNNNNLSQRKVAQARAVAITKCI